MRIDAESLDEWKRIADLINGKGDFCFHCFRKVTKLYKIPSRYSRFAGNYGLAEVEFACEYCIASMAQRRREKSRKKYLTCCSCGDGFVAGFFEASPPLCAKCKDALSLKQKTERKEKARVITQNARTQKLGLVSDLTLEQWLEILSQHNHLCHYCGEAFSDMDHVIPVSLGGGTTKSNVVPACHPCNIKRYRAAIAA